MMQLEFPHWANRDRWEESQRPVFDEICARFDEGHRLVLVDAPCGSGKSLLAYMTRQYLDVSGIYGVGTKTLQDQIERTFPDVPLLKGRANYQPVHVHGTDWRDPTCADCDRDESGMCSYCELDVDECPYLLSRDRAQFSVLPCINFSYLLGEWSSPRSRFRKRGLVIADECDTLAEELKTHVEVSISPRMQQRYGITAPEKKTVESAWPAWFEYVIPHMQSEKEDLPERTLEEKREHQRLERLVGKLETVAADLEGWVYEYEHDYIEFRPVMVDKIAPETLWKNAQRWLCMSASPGSPEAFVSDLGWEDSYATVYAPSTFDVERRPIYFCPSAFMTKKQEATSWPQMCHATKASVEMYDSKNILIHSHSYGLTRTLAEFFDGYDRPVFHYLNAEARKAVIAEFESTPGSVLIAPSLDRGYDNSDIDVGIICKVPSPYLGSKQVEKRLYETKDGKLWYANETVKTLVQAYGRIMRHEEDEGITLILDSMFAKFYGQWKRLFPEWFREAVQLNSDARFDIRHAVRELSSSSS